MKPKMLIMCGLPGSGKTTVAKKLLKKPENQGLVRISLDEIRLILTGKEYFLPAEGFVRATAELMGRYLLSQGHSVLVDATSLTVSVRRIWTGIANEFEATKICCLCYVNPVICIQRDKVRDRHVGEDVILRMAEQFEYPTKDEGFDDVVVAHKKW